MLINSYKCGMYGVFTMLKFGKKIKCISFFRIKFGLLAWVFDDIIHKTC